MVILLVATLTLPFILRYGMTKATRIAPMVLIFAISGLAVLLGNTPIVGELEVFLGGMGQLQMVLLGAGIVVVVLALYAASALLRASRVLAGLALPYLWRLTILSFSVMRPHHLVTYLSWRDALR